MTIGSQCSGYGGFDDAVRAVLGGEIAWHAEIDPHASLVLRAHTPDVPNLGDITAVDWSRVQPVDVFASGFPCQSVSGAGRQLVASDSRWLWSTGVLPALKALRSPIVVLENVPNIVSVPFRKGGRKGEVLESVLADLRAAGYAVRWCVIGACLVGACHHRHRWFALGRYVGDHAPHAERLAVKACGAPPRRNGLLPTPTVRDADPRQRGEGSVEFWQRRRIERPTQGIPLGAAVRLLPNQRGSKGDLAMPSACQPERFGEYAEAVARHAALFGRPAPEPTEPNSRDGGPRLAPRFVEWMMDRTDGSISDVVGRVPALRLLGNGVLARQAGHALSLLAHA